MKVLVYGHSYVRDLHQLCDWRQALSYRGQQIRADFAFRYFPGKDYEFLLNQPQEFEIVKSVNPDYLVIVLGGNSVVNNKTNGDVKALMLQFYQKLNTALPQTIKLAVQIEPRYYAANNTLQAPMAEEFNKRRQILNNYMNKQLKKKGLINHVVILGSAGNLTADSYRDGVHLTAEALQEYQAAILRSLSYAMEKAE